MFKVDIINTRCRPHSSFLTQSKRLIPYQDFEVFIIANRQGIVQKSHNLLFHRDFRLLLDIFQSLYFSESDMFYVGRWRKSRLVDIFVNKSHSLFCYVSQSINYFLVLYSLYEMSFLSSVLSARSYLELTDAGSAAPPSLKWARGVTVLFLELQNADIFPSHLSPHVLTS